MRTLAHSEYLAMRRFPALDGMRAIAAVMVVFFHYAGPTWVSLNGWIGVHMFFVLSGYLITTLAVREQDRTGRLSIRDFYLRRLFRIMPVYYVVLALVVVFALVRDEFVTSGLAGVLPEYLTFTNEWTPPGQVFGQSWTLGVEQKFYVVWPLLLTALGALALAWRASATVGLLGLAVIGHFAMPPQFSSAAYYMILFGCLLAFVLHSPRGFAVLRPFTHPLAAIPVVAALVLVQVNMDVLGVPAGGLPAVAGYGVAVALLVVSTLRPGPVQRVLSIAPMRFVGERSYSLYLVQGIAGTVVMLSVPAFGAHRTATGVAVTIVSLLMADLLFRWVEQPMIAFGRKVVSRPNARAERAPATAEATAEQRPEPAVAAAPAVASRPA